MTGVVEVGLRHRPHPHTPELLQYLDFLYLRLREDTLEYISNHLQFEADLRKLLHDIIQLHHQLFY